MVRFFVVQNSGWRLCVCSRNFIRGFAACHRGKTSGLAEQCLVVVTVDHGKYAGGDTVFKLAIVLYDQRMGLVIFDNTNSFKAMEHRVAVFVVIKLIAYCAAAFNRAGVGLLDCGDRQFCAIVQQLLDLFLPVGDLKGSSECHDVCS